MGIMEAERIGIWSSGMFPGGGWAPPHPHKEAAALGPDAKDWSFRGRSLRGFYEQGTLR